MSALGERANERTANLRVVLHKEELGHAGHGSGWVGSDDVESVLGLR